jgi:hypothetical protein
MRKLLILAAITLSMTMAAQTSTEKKLVINESTKVIDLDAGASNGPTYTNSGYTATFKGNSYPVYTSTKGKRFIFMVSKKSGKQYRKYID